MATRREVNRLEARSKQAEPTTNAARDSMTKRRIAILVELPATAPSSPSGIQNLRRFLKMLIRSYGIKCLSIREPGQTVTFKKYANEDEEPS